MLYIFKYHKIKIKLTYRLWGWIQRYFHSIWWLYLWTRTNKQTKNIVWVKERIEHVISDAERTFMNLLQKWVHIPGMGFPDGSGGKESTCNEGDLGWEDPLEEATATHLQYSGLENGATKSQTWLNDFHFPFQVWASARMIKVRRWFCATIFEER